MTEFEQLVLDEIREPKGRLFEISKYKYIYLKNVGWSIEVSFYNDHKRIMMFNVYTDQREEDIYLRILGYVSKHMLGI